jgi:alpha,alpha-trehalase
MAGLQLSGQTALVQQMLEDFAALIDRYGFIPNGSRSYYLSRSQPPFFALMVQHFAPEPAHYLPQLLQEYHYWQSPVHLVTLPDGSLLNRYYDALDVPRDESYREDIATYQRSGQRPTMYRQLRTAAETGWDFSSRWLKPDTTDLTNLVTTDIVPLDLNALLYHMEVVLANLSGNASYAAAARRRQKSIDQNLFDPDGGYYTDFDVYLGLLRQPTAAMFFPLYLNLTSKQRALSSAAFAQSHFLEKGGLVTTQTFSGQQWDFPYGWAPLQWVAVQGLDNYLPATQADSLANQIATRFLDTVELIYNKTGLIVEKYNVVNQTEGSGGEYPVQNGFGWTNGVVKLLYERETGL